MQALRSDALMEIDDPKKSDLTRARILDAAAEILAEHGYAGTKLVDIAQRAKIRVSTLYYYFDSREDLVQAVMVTGSAQVRHHLEKVLADAPRGLSPAERVAVAVEAHLRCVIEIANYTEATVRNAGQVPKKMQAEVAAEQARYGRLWQQLIDAAVSHDAYPTAERRRALRLLILGALNWTVEWWTPARASVDEVVATALTMTRQILAPAMPARKAAARAR